MYFVIMYSRVLNRALTFYEAYLRTHNHRVNPTYQHTTITTTTTTTVAAAAATKTTKQQQQTIT